MSVKSELSESLRREKARNLRYKKAASAELNLYQIQQNLWEIQGETSDIRWWDPHGDETMLDELIGDEEESFELRMAFSTLESDCEKMMEDLDNKWVPEFFDDFFGAVAKSSCGGMWGFDNYEGDYFGLDGRYEQEWAQNECRKRLKSHTKDEIIEACDVCFKVAINYIAIKARYDGLKSYIDILHGQNTGYLATVKRIEELYEKVSGKYAAWKDEYEFRCLVDSMPDEVWIQ